MLVYTLLTLIILLVFLLAFKPSLFFKVESEEEAVLGPSQDIGHLNYEFSRSDNSSAGNIIIQSDSEENARRLISQKLGYPESALHLEATHGLNDVIVVTRKTHFLFSDP